jgi:hypothetical protein
VNYSRIFPPRTKWRQVKPKNVMKMRIIMIVALAVIFAGGGICFMPHRLLAQTNAPSTDRKILYYTCPMHPSVSSNTPGNCPYCGMELEPVYADDTGTNSSPANGTNNAATDIKPKPYPFDICLVDGMKLDSMGGPYVFVYQGQEIKLCCANCKPAFQQNADQYMQKIQNAEGKK